LAVIVEYIFIIFILVNQIRFVKNQEIAPDAAQELMKSGEVVLGPMSTLINENLKPFLAQAQMDHASAVGIGNLAYELISIDPD